MRLFYFNELMKIHDLLILLIHVIYLIHIRLNHKWNIWHNKFLVINKLLLLHHLQIILRFCIEWSKLEMHVTMLYYSIIFHEDIPNILLLALQNILKVIKWSISRRSSSTFMSSRRAIKSTKILPIFHLSIAYINFEKSVNGISMRRAYN